MSKYILVFDSCDSYICSHGCYIFENEEELQYHYDLYGIDKDERVFEISKEFVIKNKKYRP